MLQTIARNSNQLIKSQYNDEQSLLNQLVKQKGKKRNLSLFEASSNQSSIFYEPQFNKWIDLKKTNKKNRNQLTSQTYRVRSNSQETSKTLKNLTIIKVNKPHQPQEESEIFAFGTTNKLKDGKRSTIIHARNNCEWFSSIKIPKVHHERVFSRNEKSTPNNETIQQGGLINLCFYKNKLQQIDNIRTNRLLNRKKDKSKRTEREKSRNKSKFTKYNGLQTDQNGDCRPWSPKDQKDQNQNDFPCFKSISLRP